jgi:hypothetical protein
MIFGDSDGRVPRRHTARGVRWSYRRGNRPAEPERKKKIRETRGTRERRTTDLPPAISVTRFPDGHGGMRRRRGTMKLPQIAQITQMAQIPQTESKPLHMKNLRRRSTFSEREQSRWRRYHGYAHQPVWKWAWWWSAPSRALRGAATETMTPRNIRGLNRKLRRIAAVRRRFAQLADERFSGIIFRRLFCVPRILDRAVG